MQSVQESKQELEASIRYAENAISSAKATIESMEFRQEMAKKQHSEQTGREQTLQAQVALLEGRIDDMRACAFEDAKTIEHLNEENADLRMQIEGHRTNMALLTDELEKPTMPVIPKAVAIAIFREGIATGVLSACSELEGRSINVSEDEYVGSFSVSFERDILLDDELDFDWMRERCADYTEDAVIDSLKGLCADNKFECRIHGVDDPQEKKND
jgi:uncharacterized coiled-coil protein SlyX